MYQNENVLTRMFNGLNKWIYIAVAMIFGVFLIGSIFVFSYADPRPAFRTMDTFLISAFGIVIITTILIFHFVYSRSENRSEINIRKMEFTVIGLYVLAQIAFVLLFPVNCMSDSKNITTIATSIINGDFSVFDKGRYLACYPNNLGITFFTAFVYKFLPQSLLTMRFINIIFSTVTVVFSAKIFRLITRATPQQYKFALIISALTPVTFFMTNLVYNDVPSTACLMASIYYSIKFIETKKFKYAVIGAGAMVFAFSFRNSVLLFLLAIIAYTVTQIARDKSLRIKGLAFILLISISVLDLPVKAIEQILISQKVVHHSLYQYKQPAAKWLTMGFPNEKHMGFYDGGATTKRFVYKLDSNTAAASKYFVQEYMGKISNTGLMTAMSNYLKKTFWFWTDGAYAVNLYSFVTPSNKKSQMLYETPAKPLVLKNSSFKMALIAILHAQNMFMLFLFIVSLIIAARRKDYKFSIFVYALVMFFGFYFFWEVKGRYLFALYPMFVMVSVSSFLEIIELVRTRAARRIAVQVQKIK